MTLAVEGSSPKTTDVPVDAPKLPIDHTRSTGRFAFIDGLRGIACLLVVADHFYTEPSFYKQLAKIVPHPLGVFFEHGWLGVQIFFVLSGFVIAYSQRNVYVTPGYLGNFALRRSLRLDPPYWAALALILLINHFSNIAVTTRTVPVPGIGVVLANMFYVHKILDWFAAKGITHTPIYNLLGPSWTLCMEVQFYLVLTILVGFAQRLPLYGRGAGGWRSLSVAMVFVPLALLSLWLGTQEVGLPKRTPFFWSYWYMFFLGVMIWWSMEGSVNGKWFWTYALLVGAASAWSKNGEMLVADITAVVIYSVSLAGHLHDWLKYRWLQFFGAISYSLYLVHAPLGERMLRLGQRAGRTPSMALVFVMLALTVSIFGAWVMYRLVERPGVLLGKRLKHRPAPPTGIIMP